MLHHVHVAKSSCEKLEKFEFGADDSLGSIDIKFERNGDKVPLARTSMQYYNLTSIVGMKTNFGRIARTNRALPILSKIATERCLL